VARKIRSQAGVLKTSPKIHEATITTGSAGSVTKGHEITERDAINRRKKGLDVVVCGQDYRANRNLAASIERAATGVGKYIRHGAHPSAGPDALPHYQPKTRPPDGHTFYETKGQKAT
jgi:hypothetical protein